MVDKFRSVMKKQGRKLEPKKTYYLDCGNIMPEFFGIKCRIIKPNPLSQLSVYSL